MSYHPVAPSPWHHSQEKWADMVLEAAAESQSAVLVNVLEPYHGRTMTISAVPCPPGSNDGRSALIRVGLADGKDKRKW